MMAQKRRSCLDLSLHYAGNEARVSTVPCPFYNDGMALGAVARPSFDAVAEVYERLLRAQGPSGWWPAETPFEVCVGAVLVQNTAWSNVEKALGALRAASRLSYDALVVLGEDEVAALIRPSGCYNVKARRLMAFVAFLGKEYGGRVEAMGDRDPRVVRAQLLGVPGIGPETADSIVLYAAEKPIFVIDAYTKRIFSRHGVLPFEKSYDELQTLFTKFLPANVPLYNQYHAMLVNVGNEFCRSKPHCDGCPLAGWRGVP